MDTDQFECASRARRVLSGVAWAVLAQFCVGAVYAGVPQAEFGIVATPSALTYGAHSQITVSGGSGDGDVSLAIMAGASVCDLANDTVTGIGVGTCTVMATKAADGTYDEAIATVDITVSRAIGTVAFDELTSTYDTTVKVVSAHIVEEPSATCTVPESPVGPNAGDYPVTATCIGSHYTASESATVKIAKASVTVTADAKNKTYGDIDPELTYTPTPALLAGNIFSGALARAPGESAGTYAILQGSLSAGSNYVVTYAGANLTINPRAVTVVATAKSKIYGDADPQLNFTPVPPLLDGDMFSGALSRVSGENVGNYAIQLGSLSAGGNYALTYNGANLTIAARVVTVIADAKNKIYGDADPELTYTAATPLLSGDHFSGGLSRMPGENVGNYPIAQGTLSAGSNYAVTYVGANLTIGRRAITATAAAKSKTYGAVDPSLTYTVAPDLVGSDSLTGDLSRAVGENVGAYAIEQGSLAASTNYTLTYVGANLTIAARAVTVTATAKSKTYGDADPELIYTAAPTLLSGDHFTGDLARTPGENVGDYPIVQGTLSAGDNYALTYVGANLSIRARAAMVTATTQSKVYGDADPELTYVVTPALLGGDSFSGSLARAPGEDVGTYPITLGTLSAGDNYALTYQGAALTIGVLPITVTAVAASKAYGDPDPVLTYTTVPALVHGGDFSGSLTRTSGEDAGTYLILQGSLTASANYALSYAGAYFTITRAEQAPLVVAASPAGIVVGGSTTLGTSGGSGTGAVSYAITAGASFCSLDGNRVSGISLGSCTIIATKAPDANYGSTTASTSVTVQRGADLQIANDAGIDVVAPGASVVYTLIVANAGPDDVVGARLIDTLPASLTNVAWMCVQSASTAACPTAPNNAGTGPLSVLVNLASGQHLRYDVSAIVDAPTGTQISNTASVQMPSGMIDPNPDNSATDIIAVDDGDRIFVDGFDGNTGSLTLPKAIQALHDALTEGGDADGG